MKLLLRLRPEAEQDLIEAANWYEQERKGLGGEFLDEVSNSLQIIEENPKLFVEVVPTTRRALVNRFPYSIFYLIEPKEIVVIAIFHASRNPNRWQKRI